MLTFEIHKLTILNHTKAISIKYFKNYSKNKVLYLKSTLKFKCCVRCNVRMI